MNDMDEVNGEGEALLEHFAQTLFRLMLEQHQLQAGELALTLPQVQALTLLQGAPLSTGDMAASLRISAPAVTQLTNRLTRKGLIERRGDDGDRRVVMIALAERGQERLRKLAMRR